MGGGSSKRGNNDPVHQIYTRLSDTVTNVVSQDMESARMTAVSRNETTQNIENVSIDASSAKSCVKPPVVFIGQQAAIVSSIASSFKYMDPAGMSSNIANQIQAALSGNVQQNSDGSIDWNAKARSASLPLRPGGGCGV
jgi:hypothetical protein